MVVKRVEELLRERRCGREGGREGRSPWLDEGSRMEEQHGRRRAARVESPTRSWRGWAEVLSAGERELSLSVEGGKGAEAEVSWSLSFSCRLDALALR